MKKPVFFLLTMIICSYISFACANISDYKVMTWNLQGSSASTESKWNVNVRQLLSGTAGVDILMVQEAGAVPTSAVPTGRHIQPFGVGIPIDEYTWNLGTTSRQDIRYIYHSAIDVGARRVNLAIVSRQRADNVYVLRPTTVASRPVIGIGLGNDVWLVEVRMLQLLSGLPLIFLDNLRCGIYPGFLPGILIAAQTDLKMT